MSFWTHPSLLVGEKDHEKDRNVPFMAWQKDREKDGQKDQQKDIVNAAIGGLSRQQLSDPYGSQDQDLVNVVWI